MGRIENQKAARVIALIVAATGILAAQRPLSGILQGRAIATSVTTVAVFAMIPILRKIWPIEGDTPFTARTWVVWAIFLGALALGLIAIEAPPPFLSSWFHTHPLFAQLDSAAGGWLLPAVVLLICGLIFLIRGKAGTDQGSGH